MIMEILDSQISNHGQLMEFEIYVIDILKSIKCVLYSNFFHHSVPVFSVLCSYLLKSWKSIQNHGF